MITPYSKITTIEMWTDPYISKQMLQYHIEPHHDIASRNYETIELTVDFIQSYFHNKSSICDFGCGPGLYTNLLEQKGYKVYGVDVSTNSLEYARKQNKNVTYKKLNYIEEKLDNQVDLAMMIYCDFGALHPLSQQKVLQNIHSTLHDDGYFMFDVFNMNFFNKIEESYSETKEVDGFYMEGPCTIQNRVVKYNNLGLLLSSHIVKGKKEFELYNWDKCYTKEEITILLKDNGFEVVDIFSSTTGNKDFKNEDLLFVICKKVPK